MKNEKIKRNLLYLIISIIACATFMCFVDAVIKPKYFVKSLIKLVLFLVVPTIYLCVNKIDKKDLIALFSVKKRDLLVSFALGTVVYSVIIGGYLLLRDSFDFSVIAGKLTENAGVDAGNFLYVALYISFVNSFLEEVFFRGFGFIMLKKHSSRIFAYIFSAVLFAVYHTGMMIGYYSVGVLALTIGGLFVAGVMFNFINEKSENIYASWLAHMFANFGINTVGFILFGLLLC